MRRLKKYLPKKFRNTSVEIPVVRLHGTIMSGGNQFSQNLNLANVASLLEKAFADKSAPAVAFSVNSPGGSPVQSRQIHNRIRQLAEEKDKKVFMFVEDVAASGGYMIACAGDEIYVDPSSIVGSIGVVSGGFGFPGLLKKIGVERRVYTAGKNKATLDPFMPEKKADIDRLKKLQLEIHQVFIDMVKASRGERLKETDETFTGAFWTGYEGKELGLVDDIGDMRSVLKEKFGDKTELKLISAKRGMFGGKSAPGISMLASSFASGHSGGNIGADISQGFAQGIASTVEERALWAQYGL